MDHGGHGGWKGTKLDDREQWQTMVDGRDVWENSVYRRMMLDN